MVDADVLEALLATCGDDWIDVRDRALLLTLWSTGMRRAELLAIVSAM